MQKACPMGFAFNVKGLIQPLYCGQWSCTHCRKRLARMWAWRARIQIDTDAQTQYYCWTFTLGSSYTSAKAGFAAIRGLWDTLRRAVQKKEKGWIYLAFVEGQRQRSNMPHFHVLSNKPSPYRIKDFAVHCGFGFEAYQDKVTGKKAAEYVTKYVSKGMPEAPRHFRRCRPCRKWAKLPPFEGSALLVRSKNEFLSDYLLRVSEASGTDIDTLYERWRTTTDEEW